GTICRKIAREIAESKSRKPASKAVSAKRGRGRLARPRHFSGAKARGRAPRVATGLAWTPVGGEVLFIEATAMPGSGRLTITGQLGDVMKEAAQAPLSYGRSHVDVVTPGLADDWFATHDLHVHVPAGAIPKD